MTPFKNFENYKLLHTIVRVQNKQKKRIITQKKKKTAACLMDCSMLVSTIKISFFLFLRLTRCGQNVENDSWDWAKPPAVSYNSTVNINLPASTGNCLFEIQMFVQHANENVSPSLGLTAAPCQGPGPPPVSTLYSCLTCSQASRSQSGG